MKSLKILRPILLAAGMCCLIAALAPRVMVQGKPDWLMIALLAIFVVAIPVSYVNRIKKQESSMYLSRIEKGMIITYIIIWSVFTLYSAYLTFSGNLKLTCLALVFIGASAIIDYIILYRVKKEFDTEHTA
ncbi:MAG: hypothetical protein IKV05_05140 [Bacteroidales bacterium]|nr:hypothetical protein [Bacteroidales bacterium]